MYMEVVEEASRSVVRVSVVSSVRECELTGRQVDFAAMRGVWGMLDMLIFLIVIIVLQVNLNICTLIFSCLYHCMWTGRSLYVLNKRTTIWSHTSKSWTE